MKQTYNKMCSKETIENTGYKLASHISMNFLGVQDGGHSKTGAILDLNFREENCWRLLDIQKRQIQRF